MRILADNFEERMEICLACEYCSPNKRKCRKCGCVLAYKLRFKCANCPLKKWGKDQEVE